MTPSDRSGGVTLSPMPPPVRRADIEGLRIVAVLLVVVYHYTGSGVSGGVDAFLFISGYFVLGGLLRRVQDGRPIGLRHFYIRTLRRLTPAAWATALATVVAAWFVGYWSERPNYLEQYLASSAYVENLWLTENSVVYGAIDASQNPFQHYWSLSVQGQIFVVAPVVAAGLALAVSRAAPERRRRVTGVIVLAMTFAAAVYAFVSTEADQSRAYFSMTARAWEFLAGATLAIFAVGGHLHGRVRTVLGWASLALLCTTGFLVDGEHTFPGPAALVPLAATAGVIVAGATPTLHGVDRLLSLGPVAAAGRYSYALYLVHWPVMSLLLLATGLERLDLPRMALALALSCLSAWALHHGVEAVFRRNATCVMGTRAWAPAAGLAAVALVCAVALHPVAEERAGSVGGGALARDLAAAGSDEGCVMFGLERGLSCSFDETITHGGAGQSIAVLGGSHSALWQPTLIEVADDLGARVRSFVRSRCPHFAHRDGLPGFDDATGDNCAQWNTLVTQRVVEDPADLVVTTLSRAAGPDGQVEWIPLGYRTAWDELGEAGIRVLAIRHNPRITAEAWSCVERNVDDLRACTFDRNDLFSDTDELYADGLPSNVTVLDTTEILCQGAMCPAQRAGHANFSDQSHYSQHFIASMEHAVGDCIGRLLGLEELGDVRVRPSPASCSDEH